MLRVATIGYNVSIEKLVVVRHDGSHRFHLADCLIDDCRKGR
jgi:hypothetical protein